MTGYAFRAMTRADLPLVQRWLTTPEVVRWWGAPDEQYELVSGDLDHPDMDQFIVGLDRRPFAYLQCYRLSAWNQGFGDHPPESRGIDQFIGEADLLGCGHGSQFIRQFVDEAFRSGTPLVVTDPDPKNARAIRACEKAGFERLRLVETPDGEALLMVRHSCGLSETQSSLS
jgi:aminoglycoside 6'-N-acetyltransferase